jgi:hypothetical protein
MPNDKQRPGPQTEDSAERGLTDDQEATPDPETYPHMGEAEELGQEDEGDIADEGRGHRG